jgi:hypothetical protein
LWVLGGKGHEFVVELAGVLPGEFGQADDGVLADAREACGLSNAAVILKMLEHSQDLVPWQSAVEERGVFAFGEAVLAAAAVEESVLLLGPVMSTDGQVALAPLAVQGAIRIQAAETAKVVHGWSYQ